MSLGKFPDFLLNFSGREMSRETHHSYRFKSFRLDVEDRRLFRGDVPVPLEPKVFDVLALLVENSGHLVEKNELLRTVWADSFVEETNIARAVYTLRKTLGDDGNGNKYIETVAKKGYRFVAEVTETRISEDAEGKQSSLNFVETPNDSETQLPNSKNIETVTSPAIKRKGKTQFILFGISF